MSLAFLGDMSNVEMGTLIVALLLCFVLYFGGWYLVFLIAFRFSRYVGVVLSGTLELVVITFLVLPGTLLLFALYANSPLPKVHFSFIIIGTVLATFIYFIIMNQDLMEEIDPPLQRRSQDNAIDEDDIGDQSPEYHDPDRDE